MRKNYQRRKFNRKRKNTFKIFFLILVGMTLGFAAINTTLQLIGTLSISRTTWNIHFDNPTKTGGVSAIKEVALKENDNTTVEYQVKLTNPGDYYEFTVDAKNDGTIDGMITNIQNKVYENNVEVTLPTYLESTITYSDDKTIEPNHLLASTKSETYKVKVTYKTGLAADELPDQEKTYNFRFTVTYMQADENAQGRNNVYNPGDLIQFDPVNYEKCTTGDTCYKWRVITANDNNKNSKITLQMDHNLINKDRWSTSESTSTGPDKIFSSLSNSTSLWSDALKLNYTYDTTGANYNYGTLTCISGECNITGNDEPIATNVKARIITGEEMKALTIYAGASSDSIAGKWTQAKSSSYNDYYYFSNTNYIVGTRTSGSGNLALSWLLENTKLQSNSGATDNTYDTSNEGYWTLTPTSFGTSAVWGIYYDGYFYNSVGNISVSSSNYYGIRPVIEISKKLIN